MTVSDARLLLNLATLIAKLVAVVLMVLLEMTKEYVLLEISAIVSDVLSKSNSLLNN